MEVKEDVIRQNSTRFYVKGQICVGSGFLNQNTDAPT